MYMHVFGNYNAGTDYQFKIIVYWITVSVHLPSTTYIVEIGACKYIMSTRMSQR